ncbi:MAG TPA: hypothetical protein VG845_02515 [Dehalococcoidia bacterium]|nr:hypothetical protein [Dehalococcoidia bacterium]
MTKTSSPLDKVENLSPRLHLALPKLALHAAAVVLALWLFVLALQLIKVGAGGLRPVLDSLSADGIAGHFGFGWLGAYVVLSGSPVAAVAMSLFAGGATTDLETFAMINGTRMGASLIVLVVGFVSYVTGKRNPDGLYIGVVSLLTAITLWAPAMPIGLLVLDQGWLDGVHVESPGALTSFVGAISDPIVDPLADALPRFLLFVAGVGTLVLGFAVFDRSLPSLEAPGPRFEAMSKAMQKRHTMFAFGSLVTLITMSVSLSVTILVPLALKGYVRRDRVIPYVMGANIATWVDTLLAALLLDSPRAFTVVLTEMVSGTIVSVAVLVFFYGPYTRLILGTAHLVSSARRNLIFFLVCLLLAPVAFLSI